MKRHIISISIIVFLVVCGFAQNETTSVERLKSHLNYLASDKLEGRGPGTDGLNLAAKYIALAFKENKLLPGGDTGSFFQKTTMNIGVKLGKNNRLKIAGESLKTNESFVPLGISGTAEIQGHLVFAGFGIIANEYGYNDFDEVDLTGKVALILTQEPGEKDTSSIFDGANATVYSEIRSKAINAKTNGAIAVIFVNGPKYCPHDTPLPELREDAGYHNVGIPLVQVSQQALGKALGKDKLAELQQTIEATQKPHSQLLEKIDVQLTTDLIENEVDIKNVIGIYPGKDEKFNDAPVIIGAHYDHLGYGGPASRAPGKHEIHNGADDNASGVSALLDIATMIAQSKQQFNRGIVFIAFTGEEYGMIGSTHYVNHPTFPLDKTIAMLNLDAVGRMNENKLIIFGIGTATEWERIVNGSNQKHQFELALKKDGNSPSDHAIFYTKQVPVLHFFTGANEDYHKPSDDAFKINFAGLNRITAMVRDIAEYLADRTEPLTYSTEGNVQHVAMSPKKKDNDGKAPWLGSIPDFSYQKGDGLRLGGVMNGSPAEKAGLREGDLIIKIDDVQIKSVYELHHVLQNHAAGDEISIIFLRWGERMIVQLTLGERQKQ